MQEFNDERSRDIWRTDESDMVNALAGAMWEHHVNRRARIKNFFRRFIKRSS